MYQFSESLNCEIGEKKYMLNSPDNMNHLNEQNVRLNHPKINSSKKDEQNVSFTEISYNKNSNEVLVSDDVVYVPMRTNYYYKNISSAISAKCHLGNEDYSDIRYYLSTFRNDDNTTNAISNK